MKTFLITISVKGSKKSFIERYESKESLLKIYNKLFPNEFSIIEVEGYEDEPPLYD